MNTGNKLTLTNILLEEISSALNDNSWEFEWYLDLEEERTTFLSDYDDLDEVEELRELIEEDTEGKRFIPIPRGDSREGWKQMEQFISELDDIEESTRDLLYVSIQGRGAFARFKDALFSINRLEEWYEFKNREDRKAALDWLHSEELITEDDIETGMRLYEEVLQKRKNREKEISRMVKGSTVICNNNHANEDKLTIGKAYEVLDERPADLLVRIRDERGKSVWMQKSYFGLEGR